ERQAHSEMIRRSLADILSGKQAIPVRLTDAPTIPSAAASTDYALRPISITSAQNAATAPARIPLAGGEVGPARDDRRARRDVLEASHPATFRARRGGAIVHPALSSPQ